MSVTDLCDTMDVTDLCHRIAAFDTTLTEVGAVDYSRDKINALVEALQTAANSNGSGSDHYFHVQQLILANSHVTADSLLALLSFLLLGMLGMRQ